MPQALYIVTGGAGFIGSAFVAYLNQKGINNIIIVDELASSDRWKNLVGKSFTDYMHKDEFIRRLNEHDHFGNLHSIAHMGACSRTTERDVDFLMRNNYEYTIALAEYCLRHDVRFLYASSAAATYGGGSRGYSDSDELTASLEPLNAYGYSKLLFDQYALKQGWQHNIVGLRFFNVYGPNEYFKGDMVSMVVQAYRQVKEIGVVKLFRSYKPEFKDGEQKRDFIYIKDCLPIMWWFLENPSANGIFNLGTGKARSWNDLANAVFAALGKPASIEYIEMPSDLKNQYQYFTEAKMEKLIQEGAPAQFASLEDSIKDYVCNYLEKGMATF